MDGQIKPLRIQYPSKVDVVYQEVRSRILSGEFAPATSLNQEQLAGQLGVSTTPLREALRRLETEKLVRVTGTHRDVTVAPLDLQEMRHIYEVREVLDSLAASLAAERHDSNDRTKIQAAAKAIEQSGAKADQLELNRQFHRAIYCACHNDVLIGELEALWDRSDRYRRLAGVLATDAHVRADHKALKAAVFDRRPDVAAEIMRRHLQTTRSFVESKISEDSE